MKLNYNKSNICTSCKQDSNSHSNTACSFSVRHSKPLQNIYEMYNGKCTVVALIIHS